jgi:phosphatidylserine/phosphatidylglycerophosphate/cardiolipin synthase-like enzyme
VRRCVLAWSRNNGARGAPRKRTQVHFWRVPRQGHRRPPGAAFAAHTCRKDTEKGVFASLHAKCVVVDGRWVFVTSANFTDRGQTRNVEVGVLLEDTRLAAVLEAQFVAGEWFTRVS